MADSVRVRFAPSPTGIFHVGGARSALFNWAFARQHGGTFILRIEDTDAARNRPEWTEGILSALAWIGIHQEDPAFEGPYFQSEQAGRHTEAVAKLVAQGSAYYCTCARNDVLARTGDPNSSYDGYCRDRGLTEGAVRFRTPDTGVTVVVDLVRGTPEFENSKLEDFVIARSDGSATFLLANAVDDITMRVTHVMRAEEHLPNTPKQQLLWQALGHEPPVWAHIPIIVNEKRQKLSKRRDKVALESYRAEGILPEAMVNYLMLLGWSPRDSVEIRPWSEFEALFRLEEVSSAPAFFDEKKLRAINGEYVRALPVDPFIEACQPWLQGPAAPWPPENYSVDRFAQIAPLAQVRTIVLSDITGLVDFLFLDEPVIDEKSWSDAMKGPAREILAETAAAYEQASWDAETLKTTLEQIGAAHGLKLGKAQAPVRVAVTGRTVGLPLFESLAILDREVVIGRLRAALARLG